MVARRTQLLVWRLQEEVTRSAARLKGAELVVAFGIDRVGDHAELARGQRHELLDADNLLVDVDNVPLGLAVGDQPVVAGLVRRAVDVGKVGGGAQVQRLLLGEHDAVQQLEHGLVD